MQLWVTLCDWLANINAPGTYTSIVLRSHDSLTVLVCDTKYTPGSLHCLSTQEKGFLILANYIYAGGISIKYKLMCVTAPIPPTPCWREAVRAYWSPQGPSPDSFLSWEAATGGRSQLIRSIAGCFGVLFVENKKESIFSVVCCSYCLWFMFFRACLLQTASPSSWLHGEIILHHHP